MTVFSNYKRIKIETADNINRLEVQLTSQNSSIPNVVPLLNKALSSISQLDKLYEEASTEGKRKIIGSIFPEKLTFENNEVRTTKINEALRLMLLFYKELYNKKRGQNQQNTDLSSYVIPEGANTNLLLEDLQVLSELTEI